MTRVSHVQETLTYQAAFSELRRRSNESPSLLAELAKLGIQRSFVLTTFAFTRLLKGTGTIIWSVSLCVLPVWGLFSWGSFERDSWPR